MLTDTHTGKKRLGRPRRRWEDSIRMDPKEIGINARNRVDSAQDRDYQRALVNSAFVSDGVNQSFTDKEGSRTNLKKEIIRFYSI